MTLLFHAAACPLLVCETLSLLFTVCSNADRQQVLLSTSRRITAAQQAAQQLNKQLASVHAELAAVQQLEAAVQATGRKAGELSDLLLAQDDAEQLAYSSMAKRVAEMLMQPQQQGTLQAVASALRHSSCQAPLESHTEEQAAAALDQLCSLLTEAGITGCEVPAGTAEADGPCCTVSQGRQEWLSQTLARLQADNFHRFQLCSVANWLQQQVQ